MYLHSKILFYDKIEILYYYHLYSYTSLQVSMMEKVKRNN